MAVIDEGLSNVAACTRRIRIIIQPVVCVPCEYLDSHCMVHPGSSIIHQLKFTYQASRASTGMTSIQSVSASITSRLQILTFESCIYSALLISLLRSSTACHFVLTWYFHFFLIKSLLDSSRLALLAQSKPARSGYYGI